MGTLYVTVGLPGSGKSTWVNGFFNFGGDTRLFSSDSLREELYGSEEIQLDNHNIFAILTERIKEHFSIYPDGIAVLDATNLSRKYRMETIKNLKSTGANMSCLFFAVPFEECSIRNENRDRVVPREVMSRFYETIQVPQYYEGWNNIHIIWDGTEGIVNVFDVMSEMNEFSQDNPNHTLTLGEHCSRASRLMRKLTNDRKLHVAAMLHDIGKLKTKSFYNSKGEESEIAHYYNHENIGAYDAIFYLRQLGFLNHEIIYISGLILNHMRPKFAKTEKAKNKFLDLVGEKMFNEILMLDECDRLAK